MDIIPSRGEVHLQEGKGMGSKRPCNDCEHIKFSFIVGNRAWCNLYKLDLQVVEKRRRIFIYQCRDCFNKHEREARKQRRNHRGR